MNCLKLFLYFQTIFMKKCNFLWFLSKSFCWLCFLFYFFLVNKWRHSFQQSLKLHISLKFNLTNFILIDIYKGTFPQLKLYFLRDNTNFLKIFNKLNHEMLCYPNSYFFKVASIMIDCQSNNLRDNFLSPLSDLCN